jgi:hypothetical protein
VRYLLSTLAGSCLCIAAWSASCAAPLKQNKTTPTAKADPAVLAAPKPLKQNKTIPTAKADPTVLAALKPLPAEEAIYEHIDDSEISNHKEHSEHKKLQRHEKITEISEVELFNSILCEHIEHSEPKNKITTVKDHLHCKEPPHPFHDSRNGYWRIPDSDIFLKISGMLEATAVYDANGTQSTRDNNFLLANLIDIPTGSGRNLRVDGRETRFIVQSLMPVDGKDLHACIETDFIGAGGSSIETNGYALRMRHAYFEYNGFTLGQFWSCFVDTSAFFESTTCGPIALPQVRQARFSYTHKFDKNFLLFSIENAQSETVASASATGATTQNGFPDLVLGGALADDNYKIYLRGLLGKNYVLYNNRNYGRLSYGAALSGFLKILDDKLSFSVGYGGGVGRQFHDLQGGQSTYFDGAEVRNNKMFALSVAFRHVWHKNHNVRSSLAYNLCRVTNAKEFTEDASVAEGKKSKRYETVHFNVMCSPIEKVTLGLEYIYAQRKLENQQKGSLNRIMFMATFVF